MLVLGRLGVGQDVDDLRLAEMFVESLGHVGWDRDVDVLEEAVVPEREVGELVLFLGEGVFDVDHAALRLWVDVSGELWKSVGDECLDGYGAAERRGEEVICVYRGRRCR